MSLKVRLGLIRQKNSLNKRRKLKRLSRKRPLLQRKQVHQFKKHLNHKFNLKLKSQRRNQLLQKKIRKRRKRLLRSLSNRSQLRCLLSNRRLLKKKWKNRMFLSLQELEKMIWISKNSRVELKTLKAKRPRREIRHLAVKLCHLAMKILFQSKKELQLKRKRMKLRNWSKRN